MNRRILLAAAAAAALTAFPAAAQDDHSAHAGHGTPAPSPTPTPAPQDHSQHAGHGTPAPSPTPAPAPEDHSMHTGHGDGLPDQNMSPHMRIPGVVVLRPFGAGSGTARLPGADGGHSGAHLMTGDWMLMAHGYAWGVYTDQSGPRGDAMGFVGSMAMLGVSRDPGDGIAVAFRSMLSLEPAMGAPGYPNLFATGETANGQPLVDRQHPHDLFMELSARIDVDVAPGQRLFVYGGPVAEPALGPSAFMHRASSRYLPLAPITHHWFDSTHITYGVVTLGYSSKRFQIEASAFRGREPDEERWNIESPALDSWSVRASFNPNPNWLVQVSHGRLKAPEPQHPGEDEARTTASIQYADARFSGLIAFSAKDRLPGPTRTAWLAEGNWNVAGGHNLFGRIENVANDELFPDHAHPLHDQRFRVTKLEGGYAYRLALTDNVNLALGGTVMTYAKPAALDPYYGDPVGFTAFAKLSLGD